MRAHRGSYRVAVTIGKSGDSHKEPQRTVADFVRADATVEDNVVSSEKDEAVVCAGRAR